MGLATLHDWGGERELIVDWHIRYGVPFGQISDTTKAKSAAELDPGLHAENPLDARGNGAIGSGSGAASRP